MTNPKIESLMFYAMMCLRDNCSAFLYKYCLVYYTELGFDKLIHCNDLEKGLFQVLCGSGWTGQGAQSFPTSHGCATVLRGCVLHPVVVGQPVPLPWGCITLVLETWTGLGPRSPKGQWFLCFLSEARKALSMSQGRRMAIY